jgi:hypothetical protein
MEVQEPVGVSVDACSDSCPFCAQEKYYGYKTKRGSDKDERTLAKNLRSDQDVTAGNVFPLPGGGDTTTGWEAQAGVLEDFPVKLAAAPHHLIPGNAAMTPSRVETWTCADKGKIKEDIGYNIDCAQNGIFLPHLPEIYWTRHKQGTKTPMAKYYGQTWTDLSAGSKASIGDLVMGETSLQMHYTDHDDPYAHVDNETTYDDECKQECNRLADLMAQFASVAKCKDDDGKLRPPYGVVAMLNGSSGMIRERITGFPARWQSWVSPLAQDFTQRLRTTPSAPLSRWSGTFSRLDG